VKYNPFHLLDWNATILPLLNENFGRLKRLLEKGHAPDHEKGGSDALSWGSGGGLDVDMLDGHHWSEIPTPDWQVLAEVEVGEDCDYVDFTGLDINRDWEYYLDAVIKNPTGSNSPYYLFVESDYTIGNYYFQYIILGGSSSSINRETGPWIAFAVANDACLSNVRVTRDPNGYYRYIASINRNLGSSQEFCIYAGSKTSPVSNITSLRVSASVSGAIGAGSRFILARPRS